MFENLLLKKENVDGDMNDIVISRNHGKSFLNKEHVPLSTAPLKRSK
ncbi:unnamed protein product, partial [Brassica rapa subsp. trilocularis]